ncbi:Seed maturation protein [Corchorus olitorius]|uniref:Seed maturation protein n=1 Tax=Corchorus olitorius TaxID=93759 RepID=A0A1R3KD93_9ROSI|nr:Seed maturation protein [Corchorus olitorius]
MSQGHSRRDKVGHDQHFSLQEPITIGEALQTTAISAGDKAIDSSDAAAIQAAERRATGGHDERQYSGLGASAKAAALFNARATGDVAKITISDVLSDASSKLRHDKAVTKEDAEAVRGAELRSKPEFEAVATPGGVADTIGKAARVNQHDDVT